ncbi:hypothetical protein CCACVL1_15961, partial [Corchorus capsularis]
MAKGTKHINALDNTIYIEDLPQFQPIQSHHIINSLRQ